VALADRTGRVVRRERLDHQDRAALRARVARWPAGMPVVLEASFGWGWREWMRHRMDLVAVQTQVKCRIHAIFHRRGIFHDFSDLFGAGGRPWGGDR